MRAGETDIAQIVDVPEISKELTRLGNLTGHIANMDVDVFLVDGKTFVLEMNARFGGGYPFSHMGGCNLPKAIVAWCLNQNINKKLLESQIGIVGYKELTITETIK